MEFINEAASETDETEIHVLQATKVTMSEKNRLFKK